jgi:hypothetical protein
MVLYIQLKEKRKAQMLSNLEISKRLLGGSGKITSIYNSKKRGVQIINKLIIPKGYTNSISPDVDTQHQSPDNIARPPIKIFVPPPPPPPPIPQSNIAKAEAWSGRTKKVEKTAEEIDAEKKLQLQNAHGRAVFEAMEKRRKKLEDDERLLLETKQKLLSGKGFKRTESIEREKEKKPNYKSTNTKNSKPMTTLRKLYAEKYLSIPNTNTGDTILNRLIQNYIEVSPLQKKLDEYTDRLITAQTNEISTTHTEPSQTPPLAPPPPPPNQIALSAPQLNQQTIPRQQLNLLSQIQQGRTLKKQKPKAIKSSSTPSLQDLLKQQLANRRSVIQSESGGTFHGSDRSNTYKALFEARNMYGF